MKIHWLNKSLGFYIKHTERGWQLYNQFGYGGTFPTLAQALKADRLMTTECHELRIEDPNQI